MRIFSPVSRDFGARWRSRYVERMEDSERNTIGGERRRGGAHLHAESQGWLRCSGHGWPQPPFCSVVSLGRRIRHWDSGRKVKTDFSLNVFLAASRFSPSFTSSSLFSSLFLGWRAISSLPAPPTLLHRPLSNLFLPFNFRLHPARDGIFSPRTTTFLHPLPVTQTTTICASLFFRPLIFFLLDHAWLIVAPYAVGENKRKWKFSFVSNGDHFFNFSNL